MSEIATREQFDQFLEIKRKIVNEIAEIASNFKDCPNVEEERITRDVSGPTSILKFRRAVTGPTIAASASARRRREEKRAAQRGRWKLGLEDRDAQAAQEYRPERSRSLRWRSRISKVFSIYIWYKLILTRRKDNGKLDNEI